MGSFDWERNWRGNGVVAAVLFFVSYAIYGTQPKVGAPADKLVSFWDGDRTRVLIASVIFGFAVLCLMWFAAALASALRDAGTGGWGTAATAAGAALGGWFGLWRAEIFSNAAFGAGVTAMALVLLGTTTWAGDGFWAADGAYERFVPTLAMPLWVAVVGGFLFRRSASTVHALDRAAASATSFGTERGVPASRSGQ
jgi:hypothetical protein